MPNKVFLFGEVGTGKSTICAAISLFFHERKGLTPRVNSVGNPDGTKYLQDWVRQLRRGSFPGKTDPRTYAKIDVGFVDRVNRERVGFTFFEVSGENLRLFDPTDPEHGKRNNLLDRWLSDSDTILLVGSSVPGENHRYTLQNFVEYLEFHEINKPTCLVISEWDKREKAYINKQGFQVAADLYSEAARLLADREDRGLISDIIPFSVGTVEDDESIVNLNFDAGTSQLVDWLLESMRQRI